MNRKIMERGIVLALLFFATSARATDDESVCRQYHVLDQQSLACGPSGYAQGLGARYCARFSALGFGDLSEEGLVWRDAARACLLEAFTQIVLEKRAPTCRAQQRLAFESHPPCYTDPLAEGGRQNRVSFCNLEPRDALRVLAVVEPLDLVSPLAMQQNIDIASRCVDEWAGRVQRTRMNGERLAFWREVQTQWAARLSEPYALSGGAGL